MVRYAVVWYGTVWQDRVRYSMAVPYGSILYCFLSYLVISYLTASYCIVSHRRMLHRCPPCNPAVGIVIQLDKCLLPSTGVQLASGALLAGHVLHEFGKGTCFLTCDADVASVGQSSVP